MNPNLDPGIKAYIEQVMAGYDPAVENGPVSLQRQAYRNMGKAFATPHPPGVTARDLAVEIEGRRIPMRLYRPASAGPLPAIMFFHGGGWVVGDLESHDSIAADLSAATDAAVIAVDYRLAPEHPFPAAFDDCYAALCHVADAGAGLQIDTRRIAVCGDSAGGNLAAAVALAARDRDRPRLSGQALIYPNCGTDLDLPSCHENAAGPMLTRDAMLIYWNHYMGEEPARATAYAAPLLAANFRNLAPAFVTTAQYDPLRDDGRLYAECLRNAGNAVEYRNAPRLIHGWLRARHLAADAADEFQALARALRRMLA
jgi:acetyl esterase